MKILNKFILIGLYSITNSLVAQTLKWNPTKEVEGNERYKYVGEVDGKNYFILNRSTILEFSTNFASTNQFKLDASGAEAFIADNKIKVVCFVNKTEDKITTSQLIIKTYDLGGSKQGETILFEEKEAELTYLQASKKKVQESKGTIEPELGVMFFLSENKKFIGVQKQKQIMIFETENFKKLKTFETENFKPVKRDPFFENNLQYVLLNNGDMVTIQSAVAPVTITKYLFDGSEKKEVVIPLVNEYENFNPYFKCSEDGKFLYFANVYGGKKTITKPGVLLFNVSLAKGVSINKIDLEKLLIVDSKSTSLNEMVIKETGKKDGVEFLHVRNIFEDSDGYTVLTEKEYTTNTEHGTMTTYEDIVIMKNTLKGESTQKVIKKDQYRNAGVYSVLRNGQLYVIYNDGAEPKTEIKVVKLDTHLEIKKNISEPTYKGHKIYLDVNQTHKISENKYFIFGRMEKNVGSAILELE